MMLVCGPCSAESFEQVYKTAEALQGLGIDYFRAGLWKPRTRPFAFEGVKEVGIDWLKTIQRDFNLKICTEIANPYMAQACLENEFDAVWIGARTTQNPFIVEDIAAALENTQMTVMVKNPLNPDVKLWLGAIERLEKHGIKNIIAIHRGFSVTYNKYRQSPLWRIPLELKTLREDIPILCDPSHISGNSDYVKEISCVAVSTGFDGLMIETHINPARALTDKLQQLTIYQLRSLLESLPAVNMVANEEDKKLIYLRKQIDDIDETIITALGERMAVSREIAEVKKQNNLAVFQTNRWQNVIDSVLKSAKSNSLDTTFIKEVYELIHQESIKEQNIIINKSDK